MASVQGKMDKSKLKGGQAWVRAFGPNVQPGNDVRAAANAATFKTHGAFIAACEAVGVPVTKRQASKWNNKRGAAYNMKHNVEMTGYIYPEV